MDSSQNVVHINASDLMPVARDEFIPGSTLPSDVFLKLSDDKYILIARSGTKSNFHEMHFNDKEQVETFYIRKADYKNYVGQHLAVAGILVNNPDLTEGKKAEFLSKAADTVFSEISGIGFHHESLEHAKLVTKSIQNLVESNSDLFSLVSMMSQISNDLIRHSMGVSAISVVIAKGMGWSLPQTLEKLAFGGLLHDVGMKELPRSIIDKPRHEMTFEETQLYENHVFRGVEILRSMPIISNEIIGIVYEHHENSIGQGYPRKLRDFRMQPLAKIVALADYFADLTLQNGKNAHPRTAAEAIEYIEVTMGQPFNKSAFSSLKEMLIKSNKIALKKTAA